MAIDKHGRTIDYLRISVTDRCNLRCIYCMPPDGVDFKPMEDILTFEEIERFATIAVQQGIRKIRLTGGEPLVRKGIEPFIGRLLDEVGVESVALTTNAMLLKEKAQALRDAGLERINISLDSLDPEVFKRVTRGGDLQVVLDGIDEAFRVGFHPIKINVVVVKSLNQDLFEFAKLTLDRPLHIRFIEFMPVGEADRDGSGCTGDAGGWSETDHIPSDEVIRTISEAGVAAGLGPLVPVERDKAPGGWGPAKYLKFENAEGTIGVISPLSHHFCSECNRLRLTSDGMLRPCLFSDTELDVRTALRTGTDDDIRAVVADALGQKPENHHDQIGTERSMSQIGG